MTNLLPAFQELLVSPARLRLCTQASSMTQLFDLLRRWWSLEGMPDNALHAGLESCNRQALDLDAGALAGHWLPYRYHAATRTVFWCLPRGRATTPFFDQFIGHCRSLPVNQLLRPGTALARVPGRFKDGVIPSGFIFHVSRCGSTLVSGCLSEIERACVLSESPLLTEALLDPDLSAVRQRQLLPVLLDFQARALASSGPVVKWNAWDLFHWFLIRSLYPQVPVLLLFRDPVEVLASHQGIAGRHMAGDPGLADVHPVFAGMSPGEDMLGFRIRILHSLFQAATAVCEEPGVMAVDYAQLDAEKIRAISRHFGIAPRGDEYARMQQRMKFHSKEPHRDFRPDGPRKRGGFGAPERGRIERTLGPLYRRLLSSTRAQTAGIAC